MTARGISRSHKVVFTTSDTMPTCTICGEEVETTFSCKMCGADYCANCGDPDENVCTYCNGDGEEESFEDF